MRPGGTSRCDASFQVSRVCMQGRWRRQYGVRVGNCPQCRKRCVFSPWYLMADVLIYILMFLRSFRIYHRLIVMFLADPSRWTTQIWCHVHHSLSSCFSKIYANQLLGVTVKKIRVLVDLDVCFAIYGLIYLDSNPYMILDQAKSISWLDLVGIELSF